MGYRLGHKGWVIPPPSRGDRTARAGKARRRSSASTKKSTPSSASTKKSTPRQGHRGIRKEYY